MTLHNAPPSHWQLVAVAFVLDAIVLFGALMSALVIRATARPACVCDRGEDA